MRIARYIVYGAGGIGATLGAALFRAGCAVVLIARGAQLEALREKGLEYATPAGREVLRLPVAGHPDELVLAPGDAVVLAMKTQDTLPALEALAAQAGPELPVLCAQNGVENERLALRRFRRVVGLAVWVPARFVVPGVVLNYSSGAPIELGAVPSGVDDLTRTVLADLLRAGFAAQAREDVLAWKHVKLLTNAVTSLEAVCEGGEDLADLRAAVEAEGMACLRAAGLRVVPAVEYAERVAFAVSRLGEIDGRPRQGGSSAQSLERGLGSIETDYINGEIVMLGRQHGIPTPVNEAIQRAAHALASRRWTRAFTGDELRRTSGMSTRAS